MPLRADGSPSGRSGLLACGSPSMPAFPRWIASVALVGRGLPAHSCATAPVLHRIPLVPARILSLADRARGNDGASAAVLIG